MDPSQKGIPQEEAGNVPCCRGSEVSRSQPESESPMSASIWKFAIKREHREGRWLLKPTVRETLLFPSTPIPLQIPLLRPPPPHLNSGEANYRESGEKEWKSLRQVYHFQSLMPISGLGGAGEKFWIRWMFGIWF